MGWVAWVALVAWVASLIHINSTVLFRFPSFHLFIFSFFHLSSYQICIFHIYLFHICIFEYLYLCQFSKIAVRMNGMHSVRKMSDRREGDTKRAKDVLSGISAGKLDLVCLALVGMGWVA
jgi:hypothetical protein